jgi:dienelactone hydrolase
MLCRAALLASEGYITLALAFFGTEGLPPIYKEINIG